MKVNSSLKGFEQTMFFISTIGLIPQGQVLLAANSWGKFSGKTSIIIDISIINIINRIIFTIIIIILIISIIIIIFINFIMVSVI